MYTYTLTYMYIYMYICFLLLSKGIRDSKSVSFLAKLTQPMRNKAKI